MPLLLCYTTCLLIAEASQIFNEGSKWLNTTYSIKSTRLLLAPLCILINWSQWVFGRATKTQKQTNKQKTKNKTLFVFLSLSSSSSPFSPRSVKPIRNGHVYKHTQFLRTALSNFKDLNLNSNLKLHLEMDSRRESI